MFDRDSGDLTLVLDYFSKGHRETMRKYLDDDTDDHDDGEEATDEEEDGFDDGVEAAAAEVTPGDLMETLLLSVIGHIFVH